MTSQLPLFCPHTNLRHFTAAEMAHFDALYCMKLYDKSDLECVAAARKRREARNG